MVQINGDPLMSTLLIYNSPECLNRRKTFELRLNFFLNGLNVQQSIICELYKEFIHVHFLLLVLEKSIEVYSCSSYIMRTNLSKILGSIYQIYKHEQKSLRPSMSGHMCVKVRSFVFLYSYI